MKTTMDDLKNEFCDEMSHVYPRPHYIKIIWDNDVDAILNMRKDIENSWAEYLQQANRQGIEIMDDDYSRVKAQR